MGDAAGAGADSAAPAASPKQVAKKISKPKAPAAHPYNLLFLVTVMVDRWRHVLVSQRWAEPEPSSNECS